MASLSAAAAEGSDEEDLELLEDLPLPELFGEVQRIYNRVASDALSGKDQDNAVQRGLVLIPKVAQLVRSSGVFSPNEEVEDVNTGDLRYLFVDYFRGKLVPKSPQAAGVGNPGARLQALKQARVSFLAFLHRCEAIKLIPPGPELDFLHSLDSPESALTANMSRSNKIDRFKNEKDAAARLEAVEAMLRASPDASANEDQLRERILLSLQSAVRQALEDIESIDREKGILEFMVARMGGGASSDRHGPPQSAAEDPRVQQRQSAMDAAMDPTRPGIQVTHINRNGQGSLAVSKEQIKTSVSPILLSRQGQVSPSGFGAALCFSGLPPRPSPSNHVH